MAELDFSAESASIWEALEQMMMESISNSTSGSIAQAINQVNMLISDAISAVEYEMNEDFGSLQSYASFSKKFSSRPEVLMQNAMKQTGKFTALQQAYMFLDRAYEMITDNQTEFVVSATGPNGEFFRKSVSLSEILMQTHTVKQGNILIKSTIEELRAEIKQEKYRVALEGNNLAVYNTFRSLVGKNGFSEGHLSEAIQRYLMDIEYGKTITADTLMQNIVDSMGRSRFYEEGDLSRQMDEADIYHTIETQVKNIGSKTGIITIGSSATILNGLRKVQAIFSTGLTGPALKEELKSAVFSKQSGSGGGGGATQNINKQLQEVAQEAIDKLMLQITGNSL